jgi:rhodanese-related sulfurtransferase
MLEMSRSQPQFMIAPILPVFPLTGCIPRISLDTAAGIIRGTFIGLFTSHKFVDARYGYEHKGGCIRDAINISDPKDFIAEFFDDPRPDCVVIFHCEFSQRRGPKMANQFRDYDRELHKGSYPNLFYSQVFILDGGYSAFAQKFPDLCSGGYVTMMDDAHKKNGDLAKCTTQYQEATASFDRFLRTESHKSVHAQNRSPKQRARPLSPITKIMCCFTNPVTNESDEATNSQQPQLVTKLF